MSAKHFRQRRCRRHRAEKRPVPQTHDQVIASLIGQFSHWAVSLRTTAMYEFDQDKDGNHRCKMTLPIFPNLHSIGNGGKSKKEAKGNAIIAFLAHMEKRKQVGLFVPYLFPYLLRHIQVELRRADAPPPDLTLNRNEFLLYERNLPKHQLKKSESMMKIFERLCDVRIVTFTQSTTMTFVYIVGAKNQEDSIRPYAKILFEPDHTQMFNYGEKLDEIFHDQAFLYDICQRLKVLCNNHPTEHRLYIQGSSVNVQCCYNEFVNLRREYEKELHRTAPDVCSKSSFFTHLQSVSESDQDDRFPPTEEKENDQLLDYSIYNDEVNASILRVLKEEEENVADQETNEGKAPMVIEVSDDSSESNDVEILQTIEPIKVPPPAAPIVQKRVLRHIVVDGQNIARNSNDYTRSFSWLRLSNAINYFKNRGHEHIIAFLPQYFQHVPNRNLISPESNAERQIRDDLINARLIAFTPSRYHNGKRLTNYDDRFILQYAADNDGIVVSNDNFRDLQHETNFRSVIQNRILPFATINNAFMPATDPLGRHGPNLDEFLSKIESS